jgi:hypothetical protein
LHPSKIYRLSQFEEGAGILHELIKKDDILVAHLGKIHFVLLLDMEESLRPLISQRVAILRTDSHLKPYLVRILESNPIERAEGTKEEEM